MKVYTTLSAVALLALAGSVLASPVPVSDENAVVASSPSSAVASSPVFVDSVASDKKDSHALVARAGSTVGKPISFGGPWWRAAAISVQSLATSAYNAVKAGWDEHHYLNSNNEWEWSCQVPVNPGRQTASSLDLMINPKIQNGYVLSAEQVAEQVKQAVLAMANNYNVRPFFCVVRWSSSTLTLQ